MGALKKPTTCIPKPRDSAKTSHPDPKILKAEIDRMKKLISEKIKDPTLARKAAMIISEMLDKK